jgi:hypothetical protein
LKFKIIFLFILIFTFLWICCKHSTPQPVCPGEPLEAPDYSNVTFTCKTSNFTPGHGPYQYIIIHTIEGSLQTGINTFLSEPKSAHYLIGRDGTIVQMVREADTAWHAGTSPPNPVLNSNSIGIEHEGSASDPNFPTEAMYQASAALVRYLADKYGIPKDRDHILGHQEIKPTKGDPGPYWDWDYYMKLIQASQPQPLYAGVASDHNEPYQYIPKVYQYYKGNDSWVSISVPPLNDLNKEYAVLSLISYQGQLYAGTMSSSHPMGGVGRLYRYDGENRWILVCDNLDNQVSSLAVYKGKLYIGTAWQGGRLYRYDGPNNCVRVVDHVDPGGWSGFRSLYVWEDYLYLGDIGWDIIGRYDGNRFEHLEHLGGSCIYDFDFLNDYLYAGAFEGRLHPRARTVPARPPSGPYLATKFSIIPTISLPWTEITLPVSLSTKETGK